MNLEQLKAQLRTDFTYKIIPLVKKEECEICNSTEDLIVHHCVTFVDLLNKVLFDLELNNKNDFNYNEIELIRTMMLGIQLRNELLTLCEECHTEIHNENGGFRGHNNNKTNWDKIVERRKLLKESKLKKDIQDILIPYLEININVKLFIEQQKELFDIIDDIFSYSDYRSNRINNSTINKLFYDNNIKYIIKTKQKHDYTEDGKRIKKTYRIINYI